MLKKTITIAAMLSLTGCLDLTPKSEVSFNLSEVTKNPYKGVELAPTFEQQNEAKQTDSITYSKQSQKVVSERGTASAGLSSTSTKISTVQPALTDNMSLALDLSQSSNQFAEDQAEAERSTDLEIVLSKKLQSGDKLAASVAVSHSNTGFEDTTVSNTTIAYSLKSQQIDRDNSYVYSGRVILPTNEAQREDASFQGGVSARAALTSKKQLAGKPLTVNTFIDGLKYAHQFATNADGEGNMDYRVRVYSGASVDVSEKVSVGLEGYYQAGQTTQGALKARFLLAQELAYTPKKDGATVYMAHSNDGNALGPNGEDSNIEAFDSTTSVFSAGVRASF